MPTLLVAIPYFLLLGFAQLSTITLLLVMFVAGIAAVLYRWFSETENDPLNKVRNPELQKITV